jgi:hypothetical protein
MRRDYHDDDLGVRRAYKGCLLAALIIFGLMAILLAILGH